MRKSLVLTIAVTALVFAALTGTASAASKDFSSSVTPRISMIQQGDMVSLNYSVTNNTTSDATCSYYVEEIGFTIPLGTVYAGQSAGGGISTPSTGKVTKLTFDLFCDGVLQSKDVTVAISS
jgi:hypothetical protein